MREDLCISDGRWILLTAEGRGRPRSVACGILTACLLCLRCVQVPKWEVSTQNHNCDSEPLTPTYPMFESFGPLGLQEWLSAAELFLAQLCEVVFRSDSEIWPEVRWSALSLSLFVSLSVCLYTYIYIYTYIYMCLRVYVHVHIDIYTYIGHT